MPEESANSLKEQRARLEQLKSWEHELEVLSEIEAELEVELISAEVALKSATTKGGIEIDVTSAEVIAEALIRKRELEHAIAGQVDRRVDGHGNGDDHIVRLRAAREALDEWLKADGSAASWRRPRVAYAVIGIASAAVFWAAVAVHIMLLVLLLPLAMALSYLLFTERDADWIRVGAARRYRQTSISSPALWETASVESRRSELDAELASADAREPRQEAAHDEQANEVEIHEDSELKLALALVEANDRLDEAIAAAGLEANSIDNKLTSWLHLVGEAHRIRKELAEAKRKHKELSRSAEDSREAIFRFLALHDEAPPHGKADVEALNSGLDRLANQ